VVPRVTTSSSYSTGEQATGRLRNFLVGQMLLAGDALRLDRTNAVRHFVSGF
jgi:hypothetical protein